MLTCPLSSSLNPNSILNIWKIFSLMELKEDLFMLLLQPVVGVWAGFLDLNFGCPKIHDSSCGALGMLVNLFMSVSTLLVYYIFLSHVYLLYIFFIYLAVPGLMQDLQSSLQHVGYLVVACKLLAVACGIYFSDQGSNSGPLHWECRALATGPPGKSHVSMLILWPPDAKSWLIWKDSDARKDWGQEEKVATEDETVGWHHRLNGHEFEQTLGDGEGQGSLACCSSRGCIDTEQQQHNTFLIRCLWELNELILVKHCALPNTQQVIVTC